MADAGSGGNKQCVGFPAPALPCQVPAVYSRMRKFGSSRWAIGNPEARWLSRARPHRAPAAVTAGDDDGHEKIEPLARPGEFTGSGQCLLPRGLERMLPTTIAGSGAAGKRRCGAALDDVALINRVAGKDGTAFEALYRGYYPRLRRFLERVTRRPQIVEEILNDTMLVVWRKAPSYNLRSQVSTWIFGIAFRRALKALRRVDDPVEFEPEESPDLAGAGPEGLLAQQETRASIAPRARCLVARSSRRHRAHVFRRVFLCRDRRNHALPGQHGEDADVSCAAAAPHAAA